MRRTPTVTVLGATFNAREALRLTFTSFRRYTSEAVRVIVADNGSDDGALLELLALPWIEVHCLESRLAAARPGVDMAELTRHSVTLDYLASMVTSEFFLTLDSDVEFIAPGWLTRLVAEAEGRKLAAVGEYEAGIGGYMPRLAPHLLLIRTGVFRDRHLSFQGYTEITDPEEAARFRGRHPATFRLDVAEVRSFRSARFYSTGASLFERLQAAGEPWAITPPEVRAAYRHVGHMSWAGSDTALSAEHERRAAAVRARVAAYAPPPGRHA